MEPLILDIPTIAISGSTGKTTTREFIASILKTRWKVLQTKGNNNLPPNTRATIQHYEPSYQAILLELGMGKQGAGERHCGYFKPNFVIITNIGTAHFGNLGNSIQSTAKFKSVLIKHLVPSGTLLMNNDDENSKLLETKSFNGQIVTVGISNQADYVASDVKYLTDGMSFKVILDNQVEQFFIPTFGKHNIYNALFAIAICHRLHFTISEIRHGLANYLKPIKRLNLFKLKDQSLLIDDTANANPQSVKAAVDVMVEIGKEKKKILVLGSMLELGDYTLQGHQEVGRYLAKHRVDAIFTYGKETKWIRKAAIEGGYPAEKVQHFNKRLLLHSALEQCIEPNSLILVKGSSSTKMSGTVEYLQDRFGSPSPSLVDKSSLTQLGEPVNIPDQSMYSLLFDSQLDETAICLSAQTLKQLNLETNHITLHFGALTKELTIRLDNNLEQGKIMLPSKLTDEISIPDLPYDYYFIKNHLFLGPVIGFLVLRRYYDDPMKQLLRFSNYDQIKGLVFLFRQSTIDRYNKTIRGYYYNPATKGFVAGIFPYPSAIYNRTPLNQSTYQYLTQHIGENLFNYPYGNRSKWVFYKRMSKQPNIKNHLPKTRRYRGINSLLEMLKVYDRVYLKPTKLAGGAGIFYVQKSGDGYLLTNNKSKQVLINSAAELSKTLKRKFRKKSLYILQQEIPFNQSGNKIDFRVYFQRAINKQWKYSGMETKVSLKGSIISNSKNREKIMPGETALKEIYHFNENQTEEKIREITQICVEALETMESYGEHLGDAAFDLVLDKENKVWLLELQLNYAAEIKQYRKEDERRVLPHILPTPFEYARALTGFNYL